VDPFALGASRQVEAISKDVSRIGPAAISRLADGSTATAWVRPFRFV
jgi:hypothetical protein